MSTTKPPADELAKRRGKPGVKSGRKPGFGPGPITGAKEIQAQKRHAEAVALRLAGANLRQIAEQLGYAGPAGAHAAIAAELKRTIPEETRDALRRMEIARLDRVELGHWQAAINGDEKSARIVLQCINQRSKLLGLEAPAQLNVNLYEGDAVEISVLQLLDDEQLAAALKMRDEVMELSRLRAGAIDAESS